jgi:NDP-sugar pyrophosphorylase family protein
MNAMIFAAGLGTRLQPLTNNCPKALVKIGDDELLKIALNKLKALGINKVVVNVHHFAEQIIDFIENYNSECMDIVISDERDQLLDTGGGLLKAAPLFDEGSQILIYNVDVITNAPIDQLIEQHTKENNLATLLVQNRKASRYLMFDQNNQLCGWNNPSTGEEKWVTTPKQSKKLGFNGIQIINSKLLTLINAKNSFPIIPIYLQLAKSQRISGWSNWDGDWFDVGTPEKVNNVTELFCSYPHEKRQNFL